MVHDYYDFPRVNRPVASCVVEPHIDLPTVFICKTIKGKGVSFMEDQVLWHYRSPNAEELESALELLK